MIDPYTPLETTADVTCSHQSHCFITLRLVFSSLRLPFLPPELLLAIVSVAECCLDEEQREENAHTLRKERLQVMERTLEWTEKRFKGYTKPPYFELFEEGWSGLDGGMAGFAHELRLESKETLEKDK